MYYDPNHAKLKTVANIMYQKNLTNELKRKNGNSI